MKMRFTRIVALLVIISMALTACGTPTPAPQPQESGTTTTATTTTAATTTTTTEVETTTTTTTTEATTTTSATTKAPTTRNTTKKTTKPTTAKTTKVTTVETTRTEKPSTTSKPTTVNTKPTTTTKLSEQELVDQLFSLPAGTSREGVTLKGTVAHVQSIYVSSNQATFTLQVKGTTGSYEIYCYRATPATGTALVMSPRDTLILRGTVRNNNGTLEFHPAEYTNTHNSHGYTTRRKSK